MRDRPLETSAPAWPGRPDVKAAPEGPRLAPPGRALSRLLIAGLLALALIPAAPPAAAQERLAPPEPARLQAAIDAGLAWLAEHQAREGSDAGSWSSPQYPSATTSLAGLAFLANGHLPGEGPYGAVVERAMDYVQKTMTEDGYLGAIGDTMYVHGLATLFGVSYLGMAEGPERNAELAAWVRRSVRLVVEAQQVPKRPVEQGGWRYTPHARDSDMSVSTWMILLLHAARESGYPVEDAVFEQAMSYVNGAFYEPEKEQDEHEETGGDQEETAGEDEDEGEGQGEDRADQGLEAPAGFVYRPGISRKPEAGVSGTALLLKRLLEPRRDAKMDAAVNLITRQPPSWGGPHYKGYFFFGAFYQAQGLFQMGGPAWEQFHAHLAHLLLERQQGDGAWGFPPDNRTQSRLAGEAYPVAMAVLLLSIDKQYLPMFQRSAPARPRTILDLESSASPANDPESSTD